MDTTKTYTNDDQELKLDLSEKMLFAIDENGYRAPMHDRVDNLDALCVELLKLRNAGLLVPGLCEEILKDVTDRVEILDLKIVERPTPRP